MSPTVSLISHLAQVPEGEKKIYLFLSKDETYFQYQQFKDIVCLSKSIIKVIEYRIQ